LREELRDQPRDHRGSEDLSPRVARQLPGTAERIERARQVFEDDDGCGRAVATGTHTTNSPPDEAEKSDESADATTLPTMTNRKTTSAPTPGSRINNRFLLSVTSSSGRILEMPNRSALPSWGSWPR